MSQGRDITDTKTKDCIPIQYPDALTLRQAAVTALYEVLTNPTSKPGEKASAAKTLLEALGVLGSQGTGLLTPPPRTPIADPLAAVHEIKAALEQVRTLQNQTRTPTIEELMR